MKISKEQEDFMKAKRRVMMLLIATLIMSSTMVAMAANEYSKSEVIKGTDGKYAFSATLYYYSSWGKDEGYYYVAKSGTDADIVTIKYEIYTRRYVGDKKKFESIRLSELKAGAKKRCYTEEVSFKDAESLRCSVKMNGTEYYIAATNEDY